jgi:hypothetical protein
MERASSKHNPRVDDQMAHEVRGQVQGGVAGARAEEWREPEPAGEDQPEPTMIPAGHRPGGAPPGLTVDEAEGRSRLGRYVDLSVLPTDRDGLVRSAQENNAPDDVVAELRRLPAGTTYRTVSEAWGALGHLNEEHRW